MKALVIPVDGPLYEVDLDNANDHGSLKALQDAVGGYIEAVALPDFIKGARNATAYVNEEGKLEGLPINWRATDYMVPGVGLMVGDYIAGPMVLAGFSIRTGDHRPLPQPVIDRARLIEEESGR
jgi:hypothetical protein